MTKKRRVFNITIAILASIAAWVFVVYNFRPMTQIRHNDIRIEFEGEEALADRGLAVSDSATQSVDVTLLQNRKDTRKIQSDDISITADVSECSAGDNTVSLKIRGPEGTTVLSSESERITVGVGRTKTDYKDIEPIYSGGAEAGAEPIAYDMGATKAEVSCTEERLKKIDKVAALLDYDEVGTTPKSYTCDLVALDKDGKVLPHVVIWPNEISLDASAGFRKKVALNVKYNTDIKDDYERSVAAPSTVVIKGPKSVVSRINNIDTYELDLRYVYETTEIELEYNLPEGVYVAEGSGNQTLKVTVSEKQKKKDES